MSLKKEKNVSDPERHFQFLPYRLFEDDIVLFRKLFHFIVCTWRHNIYNETNIKTQPRSPASVAPFK